MGSTTAKWLIPYPVGTDRVADGDNAMQSLAERVDALMTANFKQSATGSYQIMTVAPGWNGYGYYQIRAGWVSLLFQYDRSNWTSGMALCYVPVAYKPGTDMWLSALSNFGPVLTPIVVRASDGAVQMIADTSASTPGGVRGQVSYPLP